ncbi:MAG: multicopper oxidase domain-containing protein [Gemmatimonadota bacterium]
MDGELRIELEATEAEWFPRGPDGPRIVTPAFAERGGPPMIPGPLVRAPTGTPVRVIVHNRLGRTIQVRGLADRLRAENAGGLPAFVGADSLIIPAGESATARFTAQHEVSSFYYGRVQQEPGPGVFPMTLPGGTSNEGAFVGAFIVDPVDRPPPPDERVVMITRWGSPDEPGSLDNSWKMFLNGQSWPFTERIQLTQGDTVRWRLINTSLVDHPMHLHGFFFTVDATGDTQADTVFASAARRHVVTEVMQGLSSLRLTWVPERPGNWLFHCHLIRHMGEGQRFEVERTPVADAAGAGTHTDHMDRMAGMVMGITVHPRAERAQADPPPARSIDLWTGERAGVFGDAPELAFIVQNGAVPAPDSTRVPGSPLILTRGEPTEIVIHNRLGFPLALHWHGLELRSLYDGVGNWSGPPDMPRPPIPPGGSQRVVIEPVRAGTFFYHTHGEPGYELTQGLYGPFLVLEPGEGWDRETDRVIMLSARGATQDAPPSINGQTRPAAERFDAGRSYRLRFAQISADSYKRVRLLRDGEPVTWQPWAKDGADLPATARVSSDAQFGIGVGEAVDVRWTPERDGVYVLEVTTEYYPSRGGRDVQRMAFAVGDGATVADIREAVTGTRLELAELLPSERGRYAGTFGGRLGAADVVLGVWEQADGLHAVRAPRGSAEGEAAYMIHLGNGVFVTGEYDGGLVRPSEPEERLRFIIEGDVVAAVEVLSGGEVLGRLAPAADFALAPEKLESFTGTYRTPQVPGFDFAVERRDGVLSLAVRSYTDSFAPFPPFPLVPVSQQRFIAAEGSDAPPNLVVRFVGEGADIEMVLDDGLPPILRLRRTP